MGSESSPYDLFQAVVEVADQLVEHASIVVYLTEKVMQKFVNDGTITALSETISSKIDLHPVSDFITMDHDPLAAVRLKKEASLVIGINQVKEHQIDAFVTAGNTGALIAGSTIHLPLLQGIERPALLAFLPTKKRLLALVDVGGIVSCKAEHLVQFAHLGAAFQRCFQKIEVPKVGLLNIGIESTKGTAELRETFMRLDALSHQPNKKFDFCGNIEGREVFEGEIDVLVTDGFSGNVFLKTSEGVSSLIFQLMSGAVEAHGTSSLKEEFSQLRRHFSYDEYPGAIVCGVEGIIVKCHGAVSPRSMKKSILGACNLVKNDLLNKIKDEVRGLVNES